jgi:surface antigen
MDVSGDGWQWWSHSDGRFEHGHAPKESAVMVFDRTDSMEHGHVAIVSHIMNPRLITINHANWARFRGHRGAISTGVMVQDVSDKNDWSEVKVWDEGSRSFGRSNHILGFVYNRPGSSDGSMVAEATKQAAEPDNGIKDIDNE